MIDWTEIEDERTATAPPKPLTPAETNAIECWRDMQAEERWFRLEGLRRTREELRAVFYKQPEDLEALAQVEQRIAELEEQG